MKDIYFLINNFILSNSITKNRLKISVSIEKIVILGLIMFILQ